MLSLRFCQCIALDFEGGPQRRGTFSFGLGVGRENPVVAGELGLGHSPN
jgi:hypothetical protein